MPKQGDSFGDWRGSINNTSGVEWRGSVSQVGSINLPKSVVADPKKRPYREEFVDDAKRGVSVARRSYKRTMALYWALRIAVIVSGLFVTVLAVTDAPKWLMVMFGALAAASETAIIVANLQSRAITAGLLSEGMARELRMYEMRRGGYEKPNPAGLLFDRIEGLRQSASAERFRLDGQAPDSKKPDEESSSSRAAGEVASRNEE